MAFKVLENTGTLTTSTEGASINKLNLLNKIGIIKGRLNELAITNTTSTITIDTGHIVISGLNLILEESTYFSVSPTAERTTNYLIVEIIADGSGGITAELKLVNQYSEGSELDFTQETVTGTYRYCIAQVITTSTGIVSVYNNLKVIEYSDYVLNLANYVDSQTITSVLLILQSAGGFKTTNFDIDINADAFLNREKIIMNIQGLEYILTKQVEESEIYIWGLTIFNRSRETGITLLYDGEEGTTTISVSSNYADEPHLYEHNIVLADDSSDITHSSTFISFKILTTDSTPMDESDVAILLYERGNSGIESCLTASGRYDDDSFSFNYNGSDFETGYCDTVVIGVYANGDEELMFVVMSLNEDDQTKIYSTSASGNNWNDTVVQIF